MIDGGLDFVAFFQVLINTPRVLAGAASPILQGAFADLFAGGILDDHFSAVGHLFQFIRV